MRPLTVNEIEEVNGGGFVAAAIGIALMGYAIGRYQRYQDQAAAAAAEAAEDRYRYSAPYSA